MYNGTVDAYCVYFPHEHSISGTWLFSTRSVWWAQPGERGDFPEP